MDMAMYMESAVDGTENYDCSAIMIDAHHVVIAKRSYRSETDVGVGSHQSTQLLCAAVINASKLGAKLNIPHLKNM